MSEFILYQSEVYVLRVGRINERGEWLVFMESEPFRLSGSSKFQAIVQVSRDEQAGSKVYTAEQLLLSESDDEVFQSDD